MPPVPKERSAISECSIQWATVWRQIWEKAAAARNQVGP